MALKDLFPRKPSEAPLNLRERADSFASYVLNPEGDIIKQNEAGHWYFNAFVEGPGNELITYGAIVLGMLLRGEDVTHLLPTLEDYIKEAEQLFTNGPGDTHCEYWYMMYVNALAMEIIKRRLLPDADWEDRLRANVNRLVSLAQQIGYDFNAQGYDFNTDQPFTRKDAYRQPDAIAGYAYLMLHASRVLRDTTYEREAIHALELYQAFDQNPWYEIPSGAMACLAAAHLTAEHPEINLEKIIEFAFDPNQGCLHTGAWGGREVNGLMYGWRGYSREEAAANAYSLESMVPLPFIAPVAKYAPQYAVLIGRYALNLAANLRWYFSDCLPADEQSRIDSTAAVPYESIRRDYAGKPLYACGDFHGHKSVYGGALTLWLGEIVRNTQDEFILQLDLNATDFLNDSDGDSYLYYNSHEQAAKVEVSIGETAADIYDVGAQEWIARAATGKIHLPIAGGDARVISITPI